MSIVVFNFYETIVKVQSHDLSYLKKYNNKIIEL